MGSLDKVVLWLPYMILPLEASRGQKWPFLAILGQKTVIQRLFFRFFQIFGGQWRFAPSALRAGRCFAPFPTLTGASRRLGGPKMAKNGHFGHFWSKNRYFTHILTVLCVILYSMAAHSTSNIPAEVLETLWTKFEGITRPTSRDMSKKVPFWAILGHFWTPQNHLNTSLSKKMTLLPIFNWPETWMVSRYIYV